jgi:GNAT superfamily N-acetyltransferase
MERDRMASDLQFHPERHRGAAADIPAVLIRPFDRAYEAEVRDLLARCLREIAPPAQAEVEAYIARALGGDYRDIAAHYRPGRGRGFWMALSRDGDLMGTFALQPSGEDVVELRRMYVDAGSRRRGVARAMLARAEALCAGWGFRRLFLTTSSLNRAAIGLYRAVGFDQSDYVPGGAQGEPLPPGVRVFGFEKALPSSADHGRPAPSAQSALRRSQA